MARIYVSSTYGDLKEHREKVDRTLRRLDHNVVAMENYVAADQRPLAKCLEDVAACDLYVGIFAHRYGYIPHHDNPDGWSITELEYRHALANGKPCLVFLLDPAAPWPSTWIDAVTGDGDRGRRINALREELGRERLVSFFTTADELAQQVGAAVTNLLAQLAASTRYQLREGLPAVRFGKQAQPNVQVGGSRIFLSYRRDDTRWLAGRLFDRLQAAYGPEQVFRDVDSAKPGVRFDKRIESALAQCDVLLVLIGDTWLSATDAKGRRRLDLSNDLVLLEISVALQRGIPIIPVLVQGTPMPDQEDLPASIRDLTFFDACEVTDNRWEYDISLLLTAITDLANARTAPDEDE